MKIRDRLDLFVVALVCWLDATVTLLCLGQIATRWDMAILRWSIQRRLARAGLICETSTKPPQAPSKK